MKGFHFQKTSFHIGSWDKKGSNSLFIV